VEQKLRQMRKFRQKRKKEMERQNPLSSENSDIGSSSGMKKCRSWADIIPWTSYRNRALSEPCSNWEHKQNAPSSPFVKSEEKNDHNRKDTLDKILDSLKPIEEDPGLLVHESLPRSRTLSLRASRLGNSKPKGSQSAASHRLSRIDCFIPKSSSCFDSVNSNKKVRKFSGIKFNGGVENQRVKARTAEARIQSKRTNRYQPPLEIPNFSSTNPFKRDPGWNSDHEKMKVKRAVLLKLAELPCWKVLDGKLRQSKTALCSLCKVRWDFGDSIVTMPCMHVYHKKCIFAWLQNTPNCPQCKTSILDDGSKRSL